MQRLLCALFIKVCCYVFKSEIELCPCLVRMRPRLFAICAFFLQAAEVRALKRPGRRA